MDKLMIFAAITGSLHTPSMSPYLPITPKQLADEAVAAAEAGAAIVHTHVRDPQTGKPSSDIALFKEIFADVKKRSDVILCPSTGGGAGMSVQERTESVRVLKPEMASLNCGSINIVLAQLAADVKEWKYDWEKPYLEGTLDNVFQNSFKTLIDTAAVFAESETDADLELHDLAMINNVAYLINRGSLKTPVHINFSMGMLGQPPATIDNFVYFVRTARELIGDFRFTACTASVQTTKLQAASIAMGGDARVGMEDTVHLGNGKLATSNAELVEEVVQIARAVGREIATPDEVRKMLKLKGPNKVNF